MAAPRQNWYIDSVAYAAVTAWSNGATVAVGALRRQLAAPAVGSGGGVCVGQFNMGRIDHQVQARRCAHFAAAWVEGLGHRARQGGQGFKYVLYRSEMCPKLMTAASSGKWRASKVTELGAASDIHRSSPRAAAEAAFNQSGMPR